MSPKRDNFTRTSIQQRPLGISGLNLTTYTPHTHISVDILQPYQMQSTNCVLQNNFEISNFFFSFSRLCSWYEQILMHYKYPPEQPPTHTPNWILKKEIPPKTKKLRIRKKTQKEEPIFPITLHTPRWRFAKRLQSFHRGVVGLLCLGGWHTSENL